MKMTETDESLSRAVDELTTRMNMQDAVIARPVWIRVARKDRIALMALALSFVFALVIPWFALSNQPPPMPAPNVVINGTELADSMMARNAEFNPDTGMFMPLPSAATDADVFTETCRDVCRAEARSSRSIRSIGDAPDPRVLVNDPAHQICTCFSGFNIVRFVGWVRR